MKKNLLSKITVLFLVVCMIFSTLTACGQKDAEETTTEDNNTTTSDTKKDDTEDKTEQTNDDEQASKKEEIDPFGKYEEPITITTCVRTFDASKKIPRENTMWQKKYAEYGINVKVEWTADASQYDSKVNTVIASGAIPDLMYCCAGQPLVTLHKADMVADISQYFDYLSPTNKKWLTTGIGEDALRSVTYDGKVCMLPTNVTELINNCFPLFIRKDWLDNLGLDVPKNVDDFKKIALAFAKDDPDQNGVKDDTYGLSIMGQTNLICDWGGLYGFFGAYGVQPCTWYDGMLFYSKDNNGDVVWDGTKPEVKEGLQLLADLYKEGAIPQDFSTMDGNKVCEDLNAGKAGMVFGVRGLPIWAFNKTIKNNPDAEWYGMNMPTKDGGESPIFGFQPVNVGYVISKECEHPEAIIKMANITTALGSDINDPMFDAQYSSDNNEITGDSYIGVDNPTKEREDNEKIFEAIKTKDTSKLDSAMKDRYDKILKYEETKDPELWPFWNAYYPEEGHAYYLTFGLNNKPGMVKKNEWWYLPTDNMVSKLPVFKKMAEETMTRIIIGEDDVSKWDDMVKQWNQLGGDDITAEVRESLK